MYWRSRNTPVGVDNGVMPIDQMQVTITRPIEQVVNSVPGLDRVLSITSRGSAEVDLFFNWRVDMLSAYLTPLAAMPVVMCFCRNANTSVTGMIVITVIASK